MKPMYYFGTNFNEAGHYFFQLHGNSLISTRDVNFEDLAFNPEGVPVYNKKGFYPPKGFVGYYRVEGDQQWTILAIAGGMADKREGVKSVFFTNELLSKDQILEQLNNIPVFKIMIQKMPFEVKF